MGAKAKFHYDIAYHHARHHRDFYARLNSKYHGSRHANVMGEANARYFRCVESALAYFISERCLIGALMRHASCGAEHGRISSLSILALVSLPK